ncbi:MAG TPA: hypothetical protein VFF48_12960 [Brevundimonas sp.]|nr:hypothetical protein [Brevundimonas sp.]
MDSKISPPAPLERPRFATWLHARGLVPADVAGICGVGREQVRRYCLPFSDSMNVTPPRHVIEAVFDYTGGEITAADWYPERVSRPVAEPAEVGQ